MNRITIDLHALKQNLEVISRQMDRHGASWSIVTKAVCGHIDTVSALHALGVRSIADSRLDNLRAINEALPDLERWYLRPPHLTVVDDVVRLADVSLNSEIEVIRALSNAALKHDCLHRIVIMIELGDLREGILPGSLLKFYNTVFELPGIEVVGLGAQVGCLAGTIPNIDQMSQLLLYRELLELKFQHKLPLVSAGSSILLSLLQEQGVPRGINHFRIGEALFLGTDLVTGGTLQGLRADVVTVEGEIAEIKEKNLVASGETGGQTPFDMVKESTAEKTAIPGQRGYRALLTIGQIDTDVAALVPLNDDYQVAGASSDITVMNLGENPEGLKVGDSIYFRPGYSAFVRLMNDPYIPKAVTPDLKTFRHELSGKDWEVEVPPCLDDEVEGNRNEEN
ncbi:MAG: alanine racemase [Pseudomonadota bacterium]